MAELDLRLLGRFQARCSSGRPVELTTRKARALLAYLALHAGQAQSREKLIALLWSDRAEKQGRDSLRQALTALRRGLGAEGVALLTVDGDAIVVEPAAVDVDASRFERLLAVRRNSWSARSSCTGAICSTASACAILPSKTGCMRKGHACRGGRSKR